MNSLCCNVAAIASPSLSEESHQMTVTGDKTIIKTNYANLSEPVRRRIGVPVGGMRRQII